MQIDASQIVSLLLAILLGAAVGLEREYFHKAAGLRTNVLICLGACVFTIVSKLMGQQCGDTTTRIAAQIVGGVGFLGAGAVIQDRGGIHGITTAATIWLMAAVGVCCGAGFYLLAALTTFFALATLIGFRLLAKTFPKKSPSNHIPGPESRKTDDEQNL